MVRQRHLGPLSEPARRRMLGGLASDGAGALIKNRVAGSTDDRGQDVRSCAGADA
jgi:hypothetical protein